MDAGGVGPDGTHPSESGRRKVAELLLTFVKTDPLPKIWSSRAGSKRVLAGAGKFR